MNGYDEGMDEREMNLAAAHEMQMEGHQDQYD